MSGACTKLKLRKLQTVARFIKQGLFMTTRLGSPEPVFKIRADLPYDQMSNYELIHCLTDRGWKWQKWVPKAARKKSATIPLKYIPGGEKIWLSGSLTSKGYLRCLVFSQDSTSPTIVQLFITCYDLCCVADAEFLGEWNQPVVRVGDVGCVSSLADSVERIMLRTISI